MKESGEILPAKECYSHIGGKLGMLLKEAFVENGWIEKKEASDKFYRITEKGVREFTRLGVDLDEIKTEKI